MSNNQSVEYSKRGQIVTVTLSRPDALNAMDNEMMQGISECMDRVEQEKDVRVVVLTGAGRAFCAGADLNSAGGKSPSEEQSEDPGKQMDEIFNPAVRAVYNCPVPTVARLNGTASGGGMGLALACDIVIAAQSAFFVAPFGPLLGISPDMGSTWSLPRHVGRSRTLGAFLLGDRISAEKAEDWGLIWKAVADNGLDAEIEQITARLARSSPNTLVRIRQSIDTASVHSFSDQLDLESRHQSVLIPRNLKEAATAFMEKREPIFKGREAE